MKCFRILKHFGIVFGFPTTAALSSPKGAGITYNKNLVKQGVLMSIRLFFFQVCYFKVFVNT